MKKLFAFLMGTLVCASIGAQQPTSFPRKHLIDHFTGEDCGYCPYGMDCIQGLVDAHPGKYIWLSHHYGYGTDEYTITASSTIGGRLGVQGAPNMSIDRTRRRVNGSNVYAFHPGYLEDNAVPLNDADTSLVSVLIDHTYNPATRELKVFVHGQSLESSLITKYKVSVFVKESGMVGHQKDYYGTWEGWEQFRHVNVARAALTTALGDLVTLDSTRNYAHDTITYSVPEAWVDSNCQIVAYVTPSTATNYAVLNAEEVALVEGTQGGSQFVAEGIQIVPVPETYPESGAPRTDINFTTCNINSDNLLSYGYVTVTLRSTQSIIAGGYSCTPYLQLYVFSRTANLAAGTYPISDDYDFGVVAAGYRDDEEFDTGGSMFYYVYSSGGTLYPMAQWLLRSGQLVVGANGSIDITAKTLNGSDFHGVYNVGTALDEVEATSPVVKTIENGELRIHRAGKVYNAAGLQVK